jgi:hypothetical protein
MQKTVSEKLTTKDTSSKTAPKKGWGLLRRRECLVPTWRGWVVLALVVAGAIYAGIHGAYPFLAVNDPKPGGVLVVEGWAADYAFVAVVAECK